MPIGSQTPSSSLSHHAREHLLLGLFVLALDDLDGGRSDNHRGSHLNAFLCLGHRGNCIALLCRTIREVALGTLNKHRLARLCGRLKLFSGLLKAALGEAQLLLRLGQLPLCLDLDPLRQLLCLLGHVLGRRHVPRKESHPIPAGL